MVGKKSGRALLREEGTLSLMHSLHITLHHPDLPSAICNSPPFTAIHSNRLAQALQKGRCRGAENRADLIHRPGAHGQQHGVLDLAAGEYDQSEKLLHVCLLLPLLPFPSLAFPRCRFDFLRTLKRFTHTRWSEERSLMD